MKTQDAPVAPSRDSSPAPPSAPASASTKTARNTKNLTWRLAADALSACSAGALIAPVISIIDRSIMENASGRSSLTTSLRTSLRTLLLRPQSLLLSRPVALVFLLYSGTYMTANTVDTFTSTLRNLPASSISAGPLKFAASSASNVGLCVYKDQVFARMFGPPGALAPRPVALPSYALFTLRDCLTIFASFNLPPLLAPHIDARLSRSLRRHVSGFTAAQFLAPACLQLVSTPIHLLGLDIYNRPSDSTNGSSGGGGSSSSSSSSSNRISWRDRFHVVRANWLISAAARMGRIIPAFGVGGVCNIKVRQNLMRKLE